MMFWANCVWPSTCGCENRWRQLCRFVILLLRLKEAGFHWRRHLHGILRADVCRCHCTRPEQWLSQLGQLIKSGHQFANCIFESSQCTRGKQTFTHTELVGSQFQVFWRVLQWVCHIVCSYARRLLSVSMFCLLFCPTWRTHLNKRLTRSLVSLRARIPSGIAK